MEADSFLTEQVTFIQHHLPGLDAGSYDLKVEQSRKDDKGADLGPAFSKSYRFAVKGDRFAMAQSADIYAVFPPATPAGEYKTVLPHVVFTKKTYPWIRYPNNEEPNPGLKPGDTVDNEVPTWLTVLLLDEDDVPEMLAGLPPVSPQPGQPAYSPLDTKPMTTNGLFPKQLGSAGVSYFDTDDDKELNYGEHRDDAIRVLDIPLSLFWKLAPTLDDLGYMAHARQVSLIPKGTLQGISDQGEPLGDFSIVFGNRLPQGGKRSYAYLVSLENLEDYLPDDDGNPKAKVAGDAQKFLRLAVLKNWYFDSLPDSPAAFVNAVERLNGRDPNLMELKKPGSTGAPTAAPAKMTTLQLPAREGLNDTLRRALQMGYAPINHQLRTGEKTVSWYRGPLVPYRIGQSRVSLPVDSPDQAQIFDPTTGLFDTSYAMAWTLGRQLALQDAGFSTALYQWKKGIDLQIIQTLEAQLIEERFGATVADSLPAEDRLELEALPIRRTLRQQTLLRLLKTK